MEVHGAGRDAMRPVRLPQTCMIVSPKRKSRKLLIEYSITDCNQRSREGEGKKGRSMQLTGLSCRRRSATPRCSSFSTCGRNAASRGRRSGAPSQTRRSAAWNKYVHERIARANNSCEFQWELTISDWIGERKKCS
jgi:hypothetical protein